MYVYVEMRLLLGHRERYVYCHGEGQERHIPDNWDRVEQGARG